MEEKFIENEYVIIKYLFWQMTMKNPQAIYACTSHREALGSREIERQEIGDIGGILQKLSQKVEDMD